MCPSGTRDCQYQQKYKQHVSRPAQSGPTRCSTWIVRQTQQSLDPASQIGAETPSANRQPAEPLGGDELSAQLHETVGQCLGTTGDYPTGLVGRRFADRVESMPHPPDGRMSPEDRTQQVGAQLPRRIARGEMGQLVGQHRILLVAVEILDKRRR